MMYNEGVMKLPVYDDTSLTATQALKWGVDGSSTSTCALIDVADTGADIFAVLLSAPSTTTTNVQTPIIYQGDVIIVDNPKIWRIDYDMAAANDASVLSYTSPTITVTACDDNLDGSWVYCNSGTGVGQLRYIKGANTTTFTLNTALTTAADSTTDIVLIRNIGRPTDGMALDSTFSMIATVLAETSSTGMIVLKNFTSGASLGIRDLNITDNPDLEADGLDGRGIGFFSHIIFADTAVHAQGIA